MGGLVRALVAREDEHETEQQRGAAGERRNRAEAEQGRRPVEGRRLARAAEDEAAPHARAREERADLLPPAAHRGGGAGGGDRAGERARGVHEE